MEKGVQAPGGGSHRGKGQTHPRDNLSPSPLHLGAEGFDSLRMLLQDEMHKKTSLKRNLTV